ncbi:hypothetical protein [Snodgrassella gandavensis]|uniref:hypothetical protein n=1 Tax=Snodgrassella gandavensis TaxID=2946698 RepID=UPI001EF73659|nr:hypothetical protein [Snodgrassella gandavensis]
METIKDKLLPVAGSDTFLETFHQLYRENLEKKDNFIQEIAYLHNNKLVDIVREFNNCNNSGLNPITICQLFGEILPFLQADIQDVLNCINHLILKTNSDFFVLFFKSLEEFCAMDIARCDKLLDISLASKVDDYFNLLVLAIIVGSRLQLNTYVEKAIELLNNKNKVIIEKSLFSLSKINYQSNKKLINKVFNAVKTMATNGSNKYYPNILKSILSLYIQKRDLEKQTIELCLFIFKNEDERLIQTAAEILRETKNDLPKIIYDILLNVLFKVNPKDTLTLNYMDLILCNLLEYNREKDLYIFLEDLLIKNNNLSIKIFPLFIHKLLNNKTDILNILVTRWFLSRKIVLAIAVAEIIEDCNAEKIYLASDKIQLQGLPEGTCLFVARKACGWLFYNEISAVSFIVSLIDIATDKELEAISSLLFNPLFICYPQNIKDYFEELLQQVIPEKTAMVINQLLAQQESFFKNLNDYAGISELKPSLSQRTELEQHLSKLMNDAYKEKTSKNSILQIFSHQTILYGNSSIFYRYNNPEGTNKTREIRKFQEFSHNLTYPVLGVLDPHTLSLNLGTYRTEDCDEINN